MIQEMCTATLIPERKFYSLKSEVHKQNMLNMSNIFLKNFNLINILLNYIIKYIKQ